MADLNVWQEAIGPLHTADALAVRGIDVTPKHDTVRALRTMLGSPALISLTTTDGVPLFPDGQFTPLDGGGLRVREEVLEVWRDVLAPAILGGEVREWRAGLMMFAKQPDSGKSRADVLAEDEANAAEVTRSLRQELQELQ